MSRADRPLSGACVLLMGSSFAAFGEPTPPRAIRAFDAWAADPAKPSAGSDQSSRIAVA